MARRHTRLSLGALTLTGLAAAAVGLTAPASAATTDLVYTCQVPILGPQDFTVSLDTDAPATATVGDTVTANVTGSVTLNDATIGGMTGLLGWTHAEGTTTSDVTNMTTPRTAVSATQATLPLTGGSVTLANLTAGEHTIDAPESFVSNFKGYNAAGEEAGQFEIPCSYTSGTKVVDTITVSEAPVEEPVDPPVDDDEPTDPPVEEPVDPPADDDSDDDGADDDTTGGSPQRPDVVQTDDQALGTSPVLLGGLTLAGAGAATLLAARRRMAAQR